MNLFPFVDRNRLAAVALLFGALTLGACNTPEDKASPAHGRYRHLTLLATNDIHGHVEPELIISGADAGKPQGGLAFFAGIVQSIRTGLKGRHGVDSGVLVLDGGDQFQGTLLSNFSEGDLVFDAMNQAGYDAVVPGNHDYDFGPRGWLEDRVTPQTNQNPREVIESLAQRARFPLISANTYVKKSIHDFHRRPVTVDSTLCKPEATDAVIDWTGAERPAFLKPYSIKTVAGVRVALVGLDNPGTPSSTTVENVSDLCFRDPYETYADVRTELEGKADVFVIVIHEGNASSDLGLTRLVERIARITTRSGRAVDAVIAGHTHQRNDVTVTLGDHKIPVIQSEHSALKFGRIDLVWDAQTKTTDPARMRQFAAVEMRHHTCDPAAARAAICTMQGDRVVYEGVVVTPDRVIQDLTSQARQALAPVAGRVLGEATVRITTNRISESPLANMLTDAFRLASGVEIAFMNTGGIRAPLPAGVVTYEHFFEVLPFANRGLVIGPMKTDQVLGLLQRSIETCGSYGALMQSGLRVTFKRDCRGNSTRDANAKLERVETLGGEVLYDASAIIRLPDSRVFQVATLDFLASGGSGFDGFRGTPVIRDLGILREILTDTLVRSPGRWDGQIDGRWKQL